MASKPTPISIETLGAVTGGTQPAEQIQVDFDIVSRIQTWVGTSGNDSIDAGAGMDEVTSGGGQDTVSLGADSDRYTWVPGSGGDDSVDGGTGSDILAIATNAVSLQELLASFVPSGNSPAPVLDSSGLLLHLAGVSGSFTVGGTTLHFTRMELAVLRPV